MDNHKAHRDKVLRRTAWQEHGVEFAYLPAASSVLNPVERLWGLIKAKWANKLAERTVRQEEIEGILLGIVDSIGAAALRGVVKSSHSIMEQVIDGHLV